jgi:phospholipid transport system substrate-binding protein
VTRLLFQSVSITFAFLLSVVSVQASEPESEPKVANAHEQIQTVTDNLLKVIDEHKETYEKQPEPYYDAVAEVLDPIVDFKYIARVVMGSYGKQATKDQRQRFVEAFRGGLVETYAKGMAGYSDEKIEIVPAKDTDAKKSRVSVLQEITTSDSTHKLAYTMKRSKDGEWRLINVVLDGINLGKTFRSQFTQAAKKHDGDIDAVIDGWLASES